MAIMGGRQDVGVFVTSDIVGMNEIEFGFGVHVTENAVLVPDRN